MNLHDLLHKFNLTSITLSAPFATAEIQFVSADETAAWAMYVELITRSALQALSDEQGDEQAALASIYSLFAMTRDILREYGRKGQAFSKIALIVMNQILRPFTTKWHKNLGEEKTVPVHVKASFRKDLAALQKELRKYAALLAEMAKAEDISSLCYSDLET
ncbi:MAG: hypothetical protein LBQ15_02245 [Clostridium sp.]|jgi:hypothetical protein|nr:hypothetical protein [Clostridium sp.]